ncbi:flagellar hook-associated protein FlgK, partial [mine drainage metagenome]
MSTAVTQINSLAGNIASLNQQIGAASTSGQTPNQMLDQLDNLVNQLSKYVSVQTVTQTNGTVDVFIGSGQALVSGGNAAQLTTIPGAYNPTQLDVGLKTSSGITNLTQQMT